MKRNVTEYINLSTPGRKAVPVSTRKRPRLLSEETRSTLENLRLDRGLSYKGLAALIGVHYSTLWRGLNGHGLYDTVIFKIERFLESLRAPKF